MSAPVDVLAVIDAAIKRLNDSIPVGEVWSGAQLDEEDDLREARAAMAELIEAAKHGREWIVEVGDRKRLFNGGTLHRLNAALRGVGGAA